jgi:predicted component of type VI protein secretion system
MRFRLRYLQHDLELSEGQFVIGRSAGCQLSLDDPLVSRRHAVLVVAGDSVTIDDEQSRNGVIVNGQRIGSSTPLHAGDRIIIGSQELTLLGPSSDRPGVTNIALKQTLTKLPTLPKIEAEQTPVTHQDAETEADSTAVRRAHQFALLGGVADKALAMGRAEEAERLLAVPLGELMETARAGKRLSPSLVDLVGRFAAKLATATAKSTWVDYVVELYQGQARPFPAHVIDELNNAVRKVSGVDLTRFREYLALLHERQTSFGPAERFLLQRIEGLERLASLR